ncbi:MAG TPA: aspartyl protease family protein [Rhodanobacteraceae bacterium]|nr:aspartyl protease family protein [Rhodanobacteraceae bacterium]
MFGRWRGWALAASLLLFAATTVEAEDATSLFARYKSASGGNAWDGVKTMHATGTLRTGGLSGELSTEQDIVGGRTVNRYELGPIEGANGYDGTQAWSRDPGGEVAAQDAPEAKRRARSQSWLDALGYWYPERIGATYGDVTDREDGGRRYRVVTATPDGGDPVTLWFDASTGLLARIVQREGQDTVTTMLDDYREAGEVRMPFRIVSDRTDAAGRVDPRNRTEIELASIRFGDAIADADFAMPAMAATARIDDASGVARVRFDLVNNHIYADGAIDGKPVRFLVDTGGMNLLTPSAAARLGISGEGKLAGRGVGDEQVDVAFAHASEVRLGDAVLAKPVFVIMDLGDLPKVEGAECDGLVGYEMFRRFGVTIDYEKHELTLADPKKFSPPAGASVVPFELDDRIPIVAGALDGVPVRLSVDTGSRASLTMHSPFVREHDLVKRYRAAPEAVTGWGVGGPARGRPVRLGTLKLGDRAISGIAADLYVGDKGAFANPDLSGNLGGGVLKRFTVAFDYANKRMYLAPNDGFAKSDAFDRSGLFLIGDGDALLVADVAPQSAAARAGLEIKDRITSIDGEPATSKSLVAIRAKLRELPAGSKLEVERVRDGKTAAMKLVLADRIPPAHR